jgi:predicted AAA+ superfamily ATPase
MQGEYFGANMPEYLTRYLERVVAEDLERKMVFIAGPPQAGKTTFAMHLCATRPKI